MAKMDVECSVCGRIFQKETKQVNEANKLGYKLYCSRQCQSEARSADIEVSCANCGKKFTTKPWVVNKSKTGNVYCTKSCAATANNKLFKWGGLAYEDALERAGYKCEECGYNNELFLRFYHRDGDRFNTLPHNVVVLCPTHLAEAEYAAEFALDNETNS